MNRTVKIITYTFGAVVILGVLFLGLIFLSLPSPSDIGKMLPKKNSVTAESTVTPTNENSADTAHHVETSDANDLPQSDGNGTFDLKKEANQVLFRELLDETAPLVDVCQYMINADPQLASGTLNINVFEKKFIESGTTNNKDPYIQSFKPILKHLLRQPKLKELLEYIESIAEKGDTSFTTKADFYAQLFSVFQEISNEKPVIEEISDKSYFLYMMGKVAARKPEIASDPKFLNYCDSFQKFINQKTPMPFQETAREFIQFLDYAGVDPKDIGFDPQYKTELKIQYSKSGVTLKGGWLDELIKTN